MGRHHRAGLEHKQLQQLAPFASECANCGQRLGKHRYGDDRCPNPGWRPGNGQSQWCNSSTYREAGVVQVS